MRTSAIVEVKIAADRLPPLADTVVRSEIHLLIFDAAPQPFHEHVIAPSPFAIHADLDVVGGKHAREGRTCKLRALVRIEDLTT